MKILVRVQNYAAFIGFYKPETEINSKLNGRNVSMLLSYCIFCISSTAYLLFDSNTLAQYQECFFGWSTVTAVFIAFLIFILKLIDVFQVLENTEKMIQKRKQTFRTIVKYFET